MQVGRGGSSRTCRPDLEVERGTCGEQRGPGEKGEEEKRRRGLAGLGRAPQGGAQVRPGTHRGQLAELVGVQQQLLQAAGVAVDLLGDADQRAVALVDGLHMTVAPPQGDAVEHRRPRRRVPSRGDPGSEPAPPGAHSALVGSRALSLLARTFAARNAPRNLGREPQSSPSAPARQPVRPLPPSSLAAAAPTAAQSFLLAASTRLSMRGSGLAPRAFPGPGMLRSGFSWRPGSGEGRGTCGPGARRPLS